MTVAEQEDFERRLEQDAALNHAYQTYQQLTADLRWVAGHETLRMRLEAIDRRLDQRHRALQRMEQQERRKQVRWGLVAAIAAGVLVVVWLVLRPSSSQATDWTNYYVPDAGLPQTALGSNRPLLVEAMQYYREGHYPQALNSLQRVPNSALGQDTLLYYSGIFLLSQQDAERHEEAQALLRRVAQQPNSGLAAKARYHLGMAYWRTQQPELARTTLETVAAEATNPYQQAARRILQTDALTN
ncbi:tetratricopeptide repeat protein [Hymenobacter sp. AT01-02]|uniref:tetratricopeptide repeat protein n=1 Tax=Hymenobacter sp. AT01-02 TaxID=1571877 RepID=UPI0005F2430D|nr:tetratricopeptide repeat protein [Hymenobacter sp. AT01-02]